MQICAFARRQGVGGGATEERIDALAKGHPERKGIVERTNGYLETSFMPGRVFADPDDFNTQLGEWLDTKANVRVHTGLRCRPPERIDEDLAAMMAPPPLLPDMDWHHDLRLPADHWVRHRTNDYPVHPEAAWCGAYAYQVLVLDELARLGTRVSWPGTRHWLGSVFGRRKDLGCGRVRSGRGG